MILKLLNIITLAAISSPVSCFLVFNETVLHNINPVEDDICSDSISLDSANFKFFNKTYNSLWVCNNGIVTFTNSDSSFVPEPFPIQGNAMIAPFWGDVDNRGTDVPEGANTISYEMNTTEASKSRVDEVINQNANLKDNFEAEWVFIAHWYKVGYYEEQTNLLNTFQVVLTCEKEQQNGNNDEPPRCFCLFAYEDIQWTNTGLQEAHSQAGFNDEAGQTHEDLPGSRTAEMVNLPQMSNVGKNGLFIYELSSLGKCAKKVDPYFANMFYHPGKFELRNNCGSKINKSPGTSIDVLFMGKSFNVTVTGTLLSDRKSVEGPIPFWGKGEVVRVGVFSDGEFDNRKALNMHFIPANQNKADTELEVIVTDFSDSQMSVELEWDPEHFNATRVLNQQNKVALKVFVVQLPLDGTRGPFTFTIDQGSPIANSGKETVFIDKTPGSFFLQLDLIPITTTQIQCQPKVSFDECTEEPLTTNKPVFTIAGEINCESWKTVEKDIKNNAANEPSWDKKIAEKFGCPANFLGAGSEEKDAEFARREVTNGLIGWQYDPCCGGTATDKEFGYHSLCQPNACLLNPGRNNNNIEYKIDFCIQSPSFVVQERDINNNLVQLQTSNLCCYTKTGELKKSPMDDPGTTRKSSITPTNFLEYFLTEIPAITQCERDYYDYRPINASNYETKMVIFNWGDPHIVTFDGFQYTFNPLGVYVLTKTKGDFTKQFQMQVSSRRRGNGTVFSGCILQDSSATVEFFVSDNNNVTLLINEDSIDVEQFQSLETDDVNFSRNNISTEFSFNLLTSDVIVRAFIGVTGAISFGLSPPFEIEGNLQGLLGNFDGSPENDLLSKGELLVATNSSLDVIHNEFGETWKVEEADWLFSDDIAVLIKDDITAGSPFTPIYTLEFDDDNLRQQAEERCGDDETCLLDVRLTGEIAFATDSRLMRQRIEAVELLNEAALAAHRDNGEPQDTAESDVLSPVAKGFTILSGILISLVVLVVICCCVPYFAYIVVRRIRKDDNKVEPQENSDVFSEFHHL